MTAAAVSPDGHFVQLTDLAQLLPDRQLNALIGLLRFSWRSPRCWPGQATLAALRGCSVGKINRGIRELVGAGVVVKAYQRRGKRKTCIYEISSGYWQAPTAQNPSVSAQHSRLRTEEDSRKKLKEPPVSPPEGGDAESPFDRNVGEQEAPRTQAKPIAATPYAAQGDDPPAAAAEPITGLPVVQSAPDEAQPFYRNRQRRSGDPPLPRRRRRRERRKDDLAIIEEVLRRRYPEEAGDGLPPPEIEILPPNRLAAVRNYDGPSGVIMNLWLGAQYALEAREARRQAEDGLGDDPAERLLAAGGLA